MIPKLPFDFRIRRKFGRSIYIKFHLIFAESHDDFSLKILPFKPFTSSSAPVFDVRIKTTISFRPMPVSEVEPSEAELPNAAKSQSNLITPHQQSVIRAQPPNANLDNQNRRRYNHSPTFEPMIEFIFYLQLINIKNFALQFPSHFSPPQTKN